MQCKNHTAVAAVDRCAGCAESFCADCLVEIHGQKYCGACKVLALKGGAPTVAEEATIPCKEAGEALTMAILSLFCFGFIVGPIAISKANKAQKMIEMNPRLTGSGKAQAAKVIGIIGLCLWVLSLILRIATASR
jgi:hypothetical protein